MSPSLQTDALACHRLMDADRRHEPPEVGTKDFITRGKSISQSSMFMLVALAPKGPPRWAEVDAYLCGE